MDQSGLQKNEDADDRLRRIQELIEDFLKRRENGEPASGQSLIDTHPDLMPELEEELAKLQFIYQAWEQADQGSEGA